MIYLIYSTETAAWNRSAKEAKRLNMGTTTQYATSPRKTKAGKYALPVESYELTEEEQNKVFTEVEWPEENEF